MAKSLVTPDQGALIDASAASETLATRIADAIHTARTEGAATLAQWEGAASEQFQARLIEFTSVGYDLVDQLHSGAAAIRHLAWELAALDNVPLSMFGA